MRYVALIFGAVDLSFSYTCDILAVLAETQQCIDPQQVMPLSWLSMLTPRGARRPCGSITSATFSDTLKLAVSRRHPFTRHSKPTYSVL